MSPLAWPSLAHGRLGAQGLSVEHRRLAETRELTGKLPAAVRSGGLQGHRLLTRRRSRAHGWGSPGSSLVRTGCQIPELGAQGDSQGRRAWDPCRSPSPCRPPPGSFFTGLASSFSRGSSLSFLPSSLLPGLPESRSYPPRSLHLPPHPPGRGLPHFLLRCVTPCCGGDLEGPPRSPVWKVWSPTQRPLEEILDREGLASSVG